MPTLSPAEIQALVNEVMFVMSPEDKRTMVAIALAESGGKTDAVNRNTNGSTDIGLWQINSVHDKILPGADRKDPKVNAGLALIVWQQAGKKFTPWVAYKNGAYKKYLDKVPTQTARESEEAAFGEASFGLSDPIEKAFASFNAQVSRLASSAGAWVIAILFAVLGVVLILRQPAAKVARTVVGNTPVGKAAKGVGL